MYELLDEMLDNGYPLATEANILKAGIYATSSKVGKVYEKMDREGKRKVLTFHRLCFLK